jgi:hypothetical protein
MLHSVLQACKRWAFDSIREPTRFLGQMFFLINSLNLKLACLSAIVLSLPNLPASQHKEGSGFYIAIVHLNKELNKSYHSFVTMMDNPVEGFLCGDVHLSNTMKALSADMSVSNHHHRPIEK